MLSYLRTLPKHLHVRIKHFEEEFLNDLCVPIQSIFRHTYVSLASSLAKKLKIFTSKLPHIKAVDQVDV